MNFEIIWELHEAVSIYSWLFVHAVLPDEIRIWEGFFPYPCILPYLNYTCFILPTNFWSIRFQPSTAYERS